MRWQLIPDDFNIKCSKNIVADALSRLDKIDTIGVLNNTTTYNNKAELTLESLNENSNLNKEDILHPNSFKTIMRFQQKDKSLSKIAKENPKDYSIKHFHGKG